MSGTATGRGRLDDAVHRDGRARDLDRLRIAVSFVSWRRPDAAVRQSRRTSTSPDRQRRREHRSGGTTTTPLPSVGTSAGVAQRQSSSLPSWRCGFDSRHPLWSSTQISGPTIAVESGERRAPRGGATSTPSPVPAMVSGGASHSIFCDGQLVLFRRRSSPRWRTHPRCRPEDAWCHDVIAPSSSAGPIVRGPDAVPHAERHEAHGPHTVGRDRAAGPLPLPRQTEERELGSVGPVDGVLGVASAAAGPTRRLRGHRRLHRRPARYRVEELLLRRMCCSHRATHPRRPQCHHLHGLQRLLGPHRGTLRRGSSGWGVDVARCQW